MVIPLGKHLVRVAWRLGNIFVPVVGADLAVAWVMVYAEPVQPSVEKVLKKHTNRGMAFLLINARTTVKNICNDSGANALRPWL